MRLWLDSNCARSANRLLELARLSTRKGVALAIHPQVYLERRRQMRTECTRRGTTFDALAFDDLLVQSKVSVPDFVLNQVTTAAWADELDRRYPTDDAWERAKKATLGGELRAEFNALPGAMPMTTDWLIALVVEGDPDSRIITHDTGEEWRVLRGMQPPRALAWNDAVTWLEQLPDA